MNLDDIQQAQEDLFDESQEYFGNFYAWEEEAREEFLGSIYGEDDEED